MFAFEDKNHPGNSSEYHTGRNCIVKDCANPAGTKWSKLWCFEHNVERMNRISNSLSSITEKKP